MNLPFMTKFPDGNLTNFQEKIISGLLRDEEYIRKYAPEQWTNENIDNFDFAPKIHTIRQSYRFRHGVLLHFFSWKGKPYHSEHDRFAPHYICKATQGIEIVHTNYGAVKITIDGRELSISECETLSINDGFNSFQHFLEWFNKDFVGNIIHWTDLKY